MNLLDWFLTAEERGNSATVLDRRHPSGEAWTTGNEVPPLVHGASVAFGDQMAEVARMNEVLGLGAEGALRAATSIAAETVGLGAEVGTIAPGLGADLLVMRGRPWLDLADLRTDRIVAVVSRGRVAAGSLPAS